MRNDDALHATVQCPVDDRLLVLVDAHDRGHAPQVAGAGQVADVAEVDRPVLSLEPHRVEAGGSKAIDVFRVGQARDTAHRLTGGQFVFCSVGSHLHGTLLGVGLVVAGLVGQ